ncbi:MAG: hypothetical protein JW820_20085 [Spirochaetales bacterium]|nr:hypothetical protein [Spirochaetales bacterium]
MNPRYRWLSVIGFTGILVLGIVRVFRPPVSPRLSRVVPMVLLLGLIGLGLWGPGRAGGRGGTAAAEGGRRWEPLVEAEGLPAGYVPINTGELYLLAKAGLADTGGQQRYVLRGMVKRTPELDRQGELALVRVDGVFYTTLQNLYRLLPERVEPIEAPSPPFI